MRILKLEKGQLLHLVNNLVKTLEDFHWLHSSLLGLHEKKGGFEKVRGQERERRRGSAHSSHPHSSHTHTPLTHTPLTPTLTPLTPTLLSPTLLSLLSSSSGEKTKIE